MLCCLLYMRVVSLSGRRWGYHQEGSCQAGMSVALAEQGRQLLIGAVGSWYWQGQVFSYNFETGPGHYQSTTEGRAKDDYSYMGYSSAVGNFDEDLREDYVVGVPRGRQLQGKVVVYNQNLTVLDTIRGEQFGSYFGYSVAVTDLNGNGLDDIIVGCPLFSDFGTDNSYETGRVYIFYQSSERKFSKKSKDILDGHHSSSRFGLSVASIGDVDYDGYNDIAIGAPYGGEDGRGVVYIYHGSIKGIITDVQQAIKAEEVKPGIETFGWSLSGGMDMDDNLYPDLLVGAYDSNKALFIRSRPVVRVTPSISLSPQSIKLEDPMCVTDDLERVTCITVYTCMVYSGIGVPDVMDFSLTWRLDALKNDSSRVFFMVGNNRTEQRRVKLQTGENKCFNSMAYILNNIRDKLTPIRVDFKFDIIEEDRRSKRDTDVYVKPILNQRIPTNAEAEANILKDCGEDNICIPDLAVTAVMTRESHTLGDDKKIELLVFIENRGEDSYESMLTMTFPPGVTFYRIQDKKYEIPIFCDSSTNNESFILCDLGNPLPKKSRTNFTLVTIPEDITGSSPELIFRFQVNSSNPESPDALGNNIFEVKIPIEQSANLNIGGNEDPEQFIYSETDVRRYRESAEIGPVLEHHYYLSNKGPTATKASVITIDWPSSDENGLDLLVLTEPPKVSRPDISCNLINRTAKSILNLGNDILNPDYEVKNKRSHHHNVEDENHMTRHRREASQSMSQDNTPDKRDVEKRSSAPKYQRIGCRPDKLGCTHIRCQVGYLEPDQSVEIKIKARISTSSLINKKMDFPFYFVSKASAEVLAMPFPNMDISPSTMSRTMFELSTYVNPERLHPKRTGIQPWIIGVAVSAGLLLLLLLIVLLWWCGFFRRRRPQEQAFLVPANGDYKTSGPPDSRYHYS